jgi:membrane protein DedA with SNARE-associated domain
MKVDSLTLIYWLGLFISPQVFFWIGYVLGRSREREERRRDEKRERLRAPVFWT